MASIYLAECACTASRVGFTYSEQTTNGARAAMRAGSLAHCRNLTT